MRRRWVGLGLSTAGLVAALLTAKGHDGSMVTSIQAPGSAKPVWSEPIEVATGPASQGDWRQNDSEFHYVDDPTVAVGDGGVIAVAWVDQTRRDVFFQAFDRKGEPLAAPVNVSRDTEIFSWLPRVALAPGDPSLVYVLWQELIFSGGSHGGDIFFARSTDAGRSFDPPVNLSSSIAGDGKGRVSRDRWDNGSLDVMVGPAGEIHVAWTEYEGALWYRRSQDRGRTFTDRTRIAGDRAAPARAPSLAAGVGKDVHLSWTVLEGASPGLRVATSTDGGTAFGPPVVVSERDVAADAPRLAVDGEGTVHLVYAEIPGSEHISGVLYTRRPVGAKTFEAPRRISTSAGAAGYPSVAIDGEDGVYVVWERFPTIVGRPLGLGFAHSPDAGRTFSPPSVVPHTADVGLGFNGSLQGLLMRKLAVTETGAVVVVNSSFEEGTASRVRLILGRWDRD